MTEADLALFSDWADAGYPEGDPESYRPPEAQPEPVDLGPPDFVFPMEEPYTPEWSSQGDDFTRVFFEGSLPRDVYVRATRFVPGVPEMVHHTLVGAVDADRNLITTSDGGTVEPIAFYVPGGPSFRAPEGAAWVLPEGTTFNASMHYHRAALSDADSPPADQSEVHIWTMPAEEVTHRVGTRVVQDWTLDIPAGEKNVVEQQAGDLDEDPFTVFAAIPHTHYLGTSLRVDIIRDEDGSEECMIHEPFYSFEWQLFHRFTDDDIVHFDGGERARITCTYDNTRENQPYIDGQQLTPRDVSFGPSSLDEMCLSYLFVMWPYSPN